MHATRLDAPTVVLPTRSGSLSWPGDATVAFDTGESIFTQGDAPDCLYAIVEGKVRIGRAATDGRECVFTVLGPGDVFGEVSLLDVGPRTATAIAVTDVLATTLNRSQLLRRLADDPSSADDLMRTLARRVRWHSDALVDLMSSDAPARVSKLLLRLARRFGARGDDGIRVELDLNQEQFAQMVGTSRETVNKTLSEFASEGWIRLERDAIVIIDSQPLSRRTDGCQRSDRSSR
ncbi:MAG: family transcriptional regulator, cyclic receptor protein [Mycobacterium sp.]|jgi:CRP-like cAMP-binding protein|nr:family transcriptional regulator, cyclic receptor protein [Mycobacterium sp.]